MKRRRSSVPGRLRPDGRWFHLILLVGLLFAFAACGQATSTDQPSASEPPTSSAQPPTSESAGPAESSTPPATIELPTETGTTAEPATPEPPTTSPGAPPGSGTAAACSGSDENRDFYASMAAAVDWAVYCPVLPDGWFVDDGQYRLAGGGWMQISYDGPGDDRIVLRQGAICGAGDGCTPSGGDIGETPFGDRTGVLVSAGDGNWSVVVDRGATPSWFLVMSGIDESNARQIAADMHHVEG